uniref:Putative proline rich salivary secreted peptide n=1 Tax=Psorophora albipes TaxID=869069 RepID=T1E336_9DIPT
MTSTSVVPVIAFSFLFATSLGPSGAAAGAKKSSSSSGARLGNSLDDDELIPSYECAKRSRDWTARCLVPMTNYQMSLDLCGTNQTPDEKLVQQCVRELYILGKSCPQPTMADAAKEMMYHKKPPPPPPASASATPTKPTRKRAVTSNPLHNDLPSLSKAFNSGKGNVGGKKQNFDL